MIPLIALTLRSPFAAYAALRARGLTAADGWALIVLTAALAAILSWVGARLLPGSADEAGLLGALARQPLRMAGVQLASAALGAFLMAEGGRLFGGSGRFADALIAIGWVETVMIVLQAAQLVITIAQPALGALVGIAALLVAGYLIVAFTMAVHGFRNPLLVVLGIVGTLMMTSFLISLLAAMLGLMSGLSA